MTPFLRMRMDLGSAPQRPAWPAGYAPRKFVLSDAAALHALLAEAYEDGGGAIGPLSDWRPALLGDAEFDPALAFLAEEESTGRIAGAALCWTPGFVKDVAVARTARRRGLASALMQAAFAAFRARGLSHVDLKVRPDNASAIALYRSLGMYEPPPDER
mgnify:CR=1 FL=1